MVSTRQEKEKLVLDLYNQGKNTREIAEECHLRINHSEKSTTRKRNRGTTRTKDVPSSTSIQTLF
jgi:transposase